jgi:hypothetical protein
MRRLIFSKGNHQLESRIQEIWPSGSEGGAKPTFVPTPISSQVRSAWIAIQKHIPVPEGRSKSLSVPEISPGTSCLACSLDILNAKSTLRRSEIFIAFRPNNCDQLRRSGIKPFSSGWKMYRWSGGTLKHINRRHIRGRNRCAGDAPAGYDCIEPEVIAAMPLLRSLSQFFGVAAIQITLLRSCRYTTDGSNHCGLKQKFTPL